MYGAADSPASSSPELRPKLGSTGYNSSSDSLITVPILGTETVQYKAYKIRWLVLLVFVLQSCIVQFQWVAFAPIADLSMQVYDISSTQLNMLSMIFMILYVPASVPFVYVTSSGRYGFKAAAILGSVLSTVGCAIKFAASYAPTAHGEAYALLFIGQSFLALAQPYYINYSPSIASTFFPVSQVAIATTIASLASGLGNALGSAIPSAVVFARDDFRWMLLALFIPSALLTILCCFLPGEPESPPSETAAQRRALRLRQDQKPSSALLADEYTTLSPDLLVSSQFPSLPASGALDQQHPRSLAALQPPSEPSGDLRSISSSSGGGSSTLAAIIRDYAILLRNRNVLLLAAGFGLGLSLFNSLLTLQSQFLQPCGYYDVAGFAGGALLGAGFVSAGIVGYVMDTYHLYIEVLRVLLVGVVASMLFMLSTVRSSAGVTQVVVSWGVMGVFFVPLLPVAFEVGVECSFPLPADNSTSLLFSVAQVLSIGTTFALQALIEMKKTQDCTTVATPPAILLLVVTVLSACFLAAVRRDYRRQKSLKNAL